MPFEARPPEQWGFAKGPHSIYVAVWWPSCGIRGHFLRFLGGVLEPMGGVLGVVRVCFTGLWGPVGAFVCALDRVDDKRARRNKHYKTAGNHGATHLFLSVI